MIVRLVKMSFSNEHIPTFLSNFNKNVHHIRNFDGCLLLELYRDKTESTVFFTHSYWKSEAHLETYRQSDLFKSVWSKTKPLFNKEPQAWSVDKIVSLP